MVRKRDRCGKVVEACEHGFADELGSLGERRDVLEGDELRGTALRIGLGDGMVAGCLERRRHEGDLHTASQ